MKKVGVIYGGVSCEHDVSVITGLQIMENMDRSKYDIIPIYIHDDGEWYADKNLFNAKIYPEFNSYKDGLMKGYIAPNRPGIVMGQKSLFSKESYTKLDCVIVALHGMNGEDGSVQGLLELANIPYTSSGIVGSSVGMDKIMMKKVFEANSFPVLPYTYFIREDWEKNPDAVLSTIENKLPYPLFVKPANLGSSIGITKAKDRESLTNAITIATAFDERIVVEKAIEDVKEVNCAAIGRGNQVRVSTTEEPMSWQEFLTFEDKYMNGGKGGKLAGSKSSENGMASMSRKVPALLDTQKEGYIKFLTAEVFKALNVKGVVRVDFLIDNMEDKIYINEINTIPGSMACYLWKYDGYEFYRIIDEMIDIAEKEHAEKNRNTYTYHSAIMENFGGAKTPEE